MIIILNNNNFDFIAILLLAGGLNFLKSQPSEPGFQLIFIGNLRGSQASLANILKIKDN